MTEQAKLRYKTGYMLILFGAAVVGVAWLSQWLSIDIFNLTGPTQAVVTGALTAFGVIGLAFVFEWYIARPLIYLSRFISHIASDQPLEEGAIPDHRYGHDLVKSTMQTLSQFVQRVEQSTNITSARAQIATDAIEQLAQPVIGLDNQSRIIISNNAARELLGVDSLTGELLKEMLPINVDRQQFLTKWLEETRNTVVTATKSWPDARYVNQDRQQYVFEVHASFTRNQRDDLETVLMLVDVTEQHQADEMKVDFAAMAAHELRAPITVIRGYLDVFETKLREKFTPQEQIYIDKLKVSADQLNDFISNTLNVSRVDKGELSLHTTRQDWAPILQETTTTLQLRAETYGKQLTLSITEDLPKVLVDQAAISEVITNLVDNAIKYSKISTQIDIASRLDSNGWIETTVTDYGIGIPANLVNKLFTKYYRSHRSKDNVGGSGIGLYLSKAIVDQHHGQIWAKSSEGQGSTFGFSLPPADRVDELSNKTDSQQHGWIQNHSLYRR
jgi:signal transduction histidine kinase